VEFDSVILGASTFRHAKTSDYNTLYDANAARIVFIAGYYREQSDWLNYAFEKKGSLDNVFWILDAKGLLIGKDEYHYPNIPTYLYDDNLINDISYLLNKDMLPWMVRMLTNHTPLSFDSNDWRDDTGTDAIMKVYERSDTVKATLPVDDAFIAKVEGNIRQNIESIVIAHPETQFTFVTPPVNMFFWDGVIRAGELDQIMAAQRIVYDILSKYENVRIFNFLDSEELSKNYDLYSDTVHYLPEICTDIFEMTVAGEYMLTDENIDKKLNAQLEMITGYDYESLFMKENEK